jgi:hypothetical protein
MRYEDLTFREAEVRMGEQRELRQTQGFVSVPDFTTLYRFLQRLDARDKLVEKFMLSPHDSPESNSEHPPSIE